MENTQRNNHLSSWLLSLLVKFICVALIAVPLYELLRMVGGGLPSSGLIWLFLALMVLGAVGFVLVSKKTAYLKLTPEVAGHAKRLAKVLTIILLVVMMVIALFPVYWMVISSFTPSAKVMNIPPTLTLNANSTLENYSKVFSQLGDVFKTLFSGEAIGKDTLTRWQYLLYFANSFLISLGTVLAVMFIAVPAGYSFSRYKFKGKSALLTLIMSVQMFPIVVILISLYSIFMRWNLLDNRLGVILADTTFAMPLAITLMRSFFDTLPRSLDESARIDGAGRLRTMFNILLPLTLPGLVAVGIYTFLTSWDDYLMALTILTSKAKQTLTVGLAASFLGEYSNDYGALMAFSVGGSLPIVLLFIFFQKYMISGLTAGAVKG